MDTTEEPEAAKDAALLLHGMMCIAGADGTFAEAEVRMVEAYFAQLPELRERDFTTLMDEARMVVSRYESSTASLAALAELSSGVLKKKLFVVAVDIAMASGAIDPRESAMLTALQAVLEVDDAFRDKTFDVLSVKYAS